MKFMKSNMAAKIEMTSYRHNITISRPKVRKFKMYIILIAVPVLFHCVFRSNQMKCPSYTVFPFMNEITRLNTSNLVLNLLFVKQ